MRILFCNKYNFRFSGTEAYLFDLMDLLRSHGHQVALFSMAHDPAISPAGDGQFQAVDSTSLGVGNVLGYSLANNLGSIQRNRFNSARPFSCTPVPKVS